MTVDKSDGRVRRMFGEIAPSYDRMNHLLSMNVDRYWRWRTARILKPSEDQPILDICTGTGDLAFALHKRVRGMAPVIGSDFCPEMLAIGEQKKQRAGINGQIQFVEADAQDLPFEDDRFQIVTVAFGLRNVANTDLGLREMTRVCRRGGKVAILEFSMPQRQPMKAIYGFYFRNILPRVGQWLTRNEAQAYSYLPESVGEFPTGAQLADRMRAAGLAHVDVMPLTFGIATLYIGVK